MNFNRLNKTLASTHRVDAFDFLRAVAATSVILTHFGVIETYGVFIDCFFVLSGYLITQMLTKDEPFRNRRYIIGRMTKILPSYFFFLIVAFSIGIFFFNDIYGPDLPQLSEWKQYVFFYRNYAGLPNRWAFEHLWALCVEEHFYVLILLLSLLTPIRRVFKQRLQVVFGIIILFSITVKSQAIFTDFAEYPTYTHNRLDAFCYGSFLYLFKNKLAQVALLKHAYFIIGLIGSLLLVVNLDHSEHLLWLRVYSPIVFVLVSNYLMDYKFHKIFRLISYYSYNAYLWHYFIVIPVVHYMGYTLEGFVIYIVLTVGLTFIVTHTVEDYFITKRKWIFEKFS